MDYKARAVCFRDFDRPDVSPVCYLQPEPATWQVIGLYISLPLLLALLVIIVIGCIREGKQDYCSWR